MGYMAAHGLKRARPAELVPGTVSVITARLDYLPRAGAGRLGGRREWQGQATRSAPWSRSMPGAGLSQGAAPAAAALADRLAAEVGPLGHRVFTDSAPVLEVELATRAGLGWRGKHTLALQRDAGSMFFLGEIFRRPGAATGEPVEAHCGRCTACIDICPTRAIVAPYRLDARRCISYLTIEHHGAIDPNCAR
jgi:epoxyqueuosine reductase